MSLDEVVLRFMKKFDLKDDEVKVYMIILGGNRLTLGDISFLSGLSVDACKIVLDRLVELRFVRRVPGEVEGFEALNPFLAGFLIVYEDLTSLLEDLQKVVGSRYQELLESFDKSKTLSVEEISRVTRDRVENLKSFVEDFTKLMSSKFEERADSFRSLSVSVEEAIHSLLSTGMVSMSDVERFEEKKIFSLLDITSEFISNVEQDIAALENLAGKMLSAFIEEIRSRFEVIKSQLASVLDEHYSRHNESNLELDNKIKSIIEEDLKNLRSSIEGIESNILDLLKIILEVASNKLETFKNEYVENLNSIRNKYLDVLTSFELQTKNIIESLEKASLNLERSTSNLGSRKKAFASVVFKGDSFIEELKEQNKNLYETIKSLVTDYRKMLSEQIASTNEITERITKDVSIFMDEKTNNVKVEISTIEKKITEDITPKLPLLKTQITSKFSEGIRTNNENCEKLCVNLKQEIGKHVDNTLKNFNEALSTFEGGTKELFSIYKNNIRNSIKLLEYNVLYLRKKLAQILQTNAFEYDKMIDELYNNFTNSIKQKTEPYIEELGPFEEKIAAIITQSLTQSKNTVEKNIKDFIDKSTSILSKVGEKEEILRKIWETSYNSFIPSFKTWPLTGEKAIIAHTKSMARRTKKNLIIVCPEIIPEVLEELLNIKEFKTTIASNIDMRVFESVIKHFSRQGNVKFLNYPNRDLWCVIRDKDEVLFAPVTPKEEIIALVSEQQSYIKFYLELITSKVFSKSKEIKIG